MERKRAPSDADTPANWDFVGQARSRASVPRKRENSLVGKLHNSSRAGDRRWRMRIAAAESSSRALHGAAAGPPRVLRLAGDRPDHDPSAVPGPSTPPVLSLSLSLSLVFSSFNAYRAIGEEDSLPVSPPRSPRFSRAPSRGTDWTIHHRGFSLVHAGLSALSPFLSFLSFPSSSVSIAKESDAHVRASHFQVCVARGCVRV